MANVFTLYGELKADTATFARSLREADAALLKTKVAIEQTEKQSVSMGRTSATTARGFEKLTEAVKQQRQRLTDAAVAYSKGEISGKRYAAVVGQTETKVHSLNSRLKDAKARMMDFGNASQRAGMGLREVFGGTLLAGGVMRMGRAMKDFTADGVKMFATLDKLTRFTATLDKNFQSPKALEKFREDIMQLSTQIPHSAESIAEASFTIKSAFQDITQTDLIDYLREFGNAATASNTGIAEHAFNMAALAKQYKITKEELPKFGALIASSFGQALAADAQVAQGFNKILNSAKSTKQPLEDMVAAMSTLQSASSDAQMNTTLLLNVYSKLTDPKYIEGIKEMGVSVFDATGNFRALNDIINDMAKELQGLSDEEINAKLAWAKDAQAREGIKTLVRLVGDYNKTLKDGADEDAFKAKNELMLNSVEARWEKFTNKINNLKMRLGSGVLNFVEEAEALKPPKSWSGEEWRGILIKGLRRAITGAYTDVQPIATRNGTTLGENLAQGMSAGISGGQSGVISAAIHMAQAAYQAAKDVLGIQSPSKLFKNIGKDVAQGFIDGIASMRTGVQKAMADLLDVTSIFGKLGKKDAPGVQLLAELVKELDELTPRTRLEAVMAELTAEKYKKLNEEVRKRIILAAQQLDLDTKRKKLAELWKDPLTSVDFEGTGFEPNAEGTGTGFALPDPSVAQQVAQSIKEMMEALRTPIPPPIDPWNNFWVMMQREVGRFSASLPSIKEAIGTNLIDSIAGIGDVFANAIAYWDGTAKGFFQSLAQGFRQMIQQIIAELVRLMVMKAVMQLIGSFAGGIGGIGGGGITTGLGGAGNPGGIASGGLAAGGMVNGPGTSTSDSIWARLSKGEFVVNAKAVREVGRGFMEHLNAGFPGTPMLAAGGYVGSSSMTTNNSWAPQFTINVSGGGNPERVKQSVKQGVSEAMRIMEHERRRNK